MNIYKNFYEEFILNHNKSFYFFNIESFRNIYENTRKECLNFDEKTKNILIKAWNDDINQCDIISGPNFSIEVSKIYKLEDIPISDINDIYTDWIREAAIRDFLIEKKLIIINI
jgi:hypothetical protein